MKSGTTKPVRCAIYTRHDAAESYIRSQVHAGWTLIRARYHDGGYSGGSTVLRRISEQQIGLLLAINPPNSAHQLALIIMSSE